MPISHEFFDWIVGLATPVITAIMWFIRLEVSKIRSDMALDRAKLVTDNLLLANNLTNHIANDEVNNKSTADALRQINYKLDKHYSR